jgi:hypothetical protein
METVDRSKVVRAVYPALRARRAAGADAAVIDNALSCAAEGYPFPTNLDRDPNVGGLTPLSEYQLVQQALAADWPPARIAQALDEYHARHRTDEI